ncbi:bZIP transcription factor 1 [Phytophthora citrophthora]|uniref:BZIP transcription factor 1 n=1 Tax=Phytophthora citrophthora TaxID=4793 RepID=A0AAD9GEU3_9STRA|nr:bZIP transcription factor 1 [Phytophthora citrophthora]
MVDRDRPPSRSDEVSNVQTNRYLRQEAPTSTPENFFMNEEFYFTDQAQPLETRKTNSSQRDEASTLKRYRERRRLTQIRYRSKLRNHGTSLENEVALLRQQVQALETQHRSIIPHIIAHMTPFNTVAEYFRLFRYGLTTAYVPVSERCGIQGLPNVYESRQHRGFLEASMAPSILVDSDQGVEAILKRWRLISSSQPNVELQLVRIENGPGDTVVATTKTDPTKEDLWLGNCWDNGLFYMDLWFLDGISENDHITSLQSEANLLDPMLRVLNGLEDIAFVIDNSLVTLEESVAVAMPTLPYGPERTTSKPTTKATVEFKGVTTFALPPAHSYSYCISLESGHLRISLEDCESKKQWCTRELSLEDYIDSSNSIPNASPSDYIECFHSLLTEPLEDKSSIPRALKNCNDEQLRLDIRVKMQALMKSRVVTYSFKLEPVSVERIDVLELKIRDLQDEVKAVRVAATSKDSEMQKAIADLRTEMNLLRETAKTPVVFLARATSQAGVEGAIVWRCEGLKVVDGAICDLNPGIYQVVIAVDFDSNRRPTSHIRLSKGAKVVCNSSGSLQVSMTSIIHVHKGDNLSVQTDGSVSSGYMTLTLLAKLSV